MTSVHTTYAKSSDSNAIVRYNKHLESIQYITTAVSTSRTRLIPGATSFKVDFKSYYYFMFTMHC